jgi:hypothetical protein
MTFQVWRFEIVDGQRQPTLAIGMPYSTREEAERKLGETRKAFEVFARHYQFEVVELSDLVKQPEPPLAEHCVVTSKLQAGFGHPYSLFVDYKCPLCNKGFKVGLDNISGPGKKLYLCECGGTITLPLQFAIDQAKPRQQPIVQNAPWLKFWNRNN